MPSDRNSLKENVNGSKNTRMNIDNAFKDTDFRKDEIMHLGRYFKGAQSMIDLAKDLGRPIRVLDLGCGEVHTAKLFYKSFLIKKSEVLESYIGVDIDNIATDKFLQVEASMCKSLNLSIINQDLTVNPQLDLPDNYFDLVICYEFLEHIQPKFVPMILLEVNRLLSPKGKAVFSTPNSTGSNSALPKDHIYEWGYEELCEKFLEAGFTIRKTTGVCVNISKIPKEEKKEKQEVIDLIYQTFGNNTAFSSVAMAPLFNPVNCKNVMYELIK